MLETFLLRVMDGDFSWPTEEGRVAKNSDVKVGVVLSAGQKFVG